MYRRKRLKNWMKVALWSLLVAILLANPYTRTIIILILPLGSGVDDFIEIVALLVFLIIMATKTRDNWDKIVTWFKDEDDTYYEPQNYKDDDFE